ncbi:MAG: TlpA disulfide reductase family protein [Acidobacteriota bacterium]|nr:TlpA disulfide reductase family protein [Acidobacteriota bacterium]
MGNKTWLIVALLAVLAACSGRPSVERAREMAAAFGELTERYDLLNDQLVEKMERAGEMRSGDKFSSETSRIAAEKKLELEKLLDKFGSGAGSDSLDLVRSKVMIEAGRFDEAETIIGRLAAAKGETASEAKLQQVILHLMRQRYAEAAGLLREIEPVIAKDAQFYNLCLALAFSHPDPAAREEFSRQLVDAPWLPARIEPQKGRIYANLAMLAKENHHAADALAQWDKALALESDPAVRSAWEVEKKQLAMLDRPMPPLNADNWLNSQPLDLEEFKNKVVVIDFWAPWCSSCRQVMPILQNQYRLHKEKGLLVIGYTRLYGRFSDELERRDKVAADEELALVRKYVDRNRITYPIAVATEGAGFDAYAVKAIPTLVFIDRKGNIAYFKTGADSQKQIEDKIIALLEEK